MKLGSYVCWGSDEKRHHSCLWQLNTALGLGTLRKVIQGLVLPQRPACTGDLRAYPWQTKGKRCTYQKHTVSVYTGPRSHCQQSQVTHVPMCLSTKPQKKTVKWNLTMYPRHVTLLHQSECWDRRYWPPWPALQRRKSNVKVSTPCAAWRKIRVNHQCALNSN